MKKEAAEFITFDSQSDFFSALADIINCPDEDERESVADAIRNLRYDSMGLGIIYY
jgi:hypothetical protein